MRLRSHVVFAPDGRTRQQAEEDEHQLRLHLSPGYVNIIDLPIIKRRRYRRPRTLPSTDADQLRRIEATLKGFQRSCDADVLLDFYDAGKLPPISSILDFHAVPPRRDAALDIDFSLVVAPPFERSYPLRSEGPILLPEAMQRPKPKHGFVRIEYWKALRNEAGRRTELIIPVAGEHPCGGAVQAYASKPQWKLIDDDFGAEPPIELSLPRIWALWGTLDRLAVSSRFGLGRIEFVRRPDSIYFVVECDADRVSHAAGWIRLWAADMSTGQLFMKSALFVCVDVPTRQALFTI